MSYHMVLERHVISISISESSDMPALGLSNEHLRDAMTEVARHVLRLGARLVYGGDLRQYGFSELLFEIVSRHHHDGEDGNMHVGVTNYLAWPVHIIKSFDELQKTASDLTGSAELVCLTLDGKIMTMKERQRLRPQQPTESDWCKGLTAMRRRMLEETHARIILGGRTDQYMGIMPGIGEEALLSLQNRQPLFLIGGFGGCTSDIAVRLGLMDQLAFSRPSWQGHAAFKDFSAADLNNGLTFEENVTLARTPHIDQAITLILRGLLHVGSGGVK